MKNVIVVTLLLLIGSMVVGAPVTDPMPDNPIVSIFDYQVDDHYVHEFVITSKLVIECVVSESVNDVAFEKFAANDTSPSERLKRNTVTQSTLQEFQFFHTHCKSLTAKSLAPAPDLIRS